MKILSWNVNGIRAIFGKDFLPILRELNPDILCLQEIKAKERQVPEELTELSDYELIINSAQRPGYSGTAVLTKEEPDEVEKGIGLERFDNEGRMIRLDFSDFSLLNLYMPNGGRDKKDMDYKLDSFDFLFDYIRDEENLLLCGDFNIAHKAKDLARPKGNKNNTGFTPPERRKITRLLELGFVDTFRLFEKEGGHYSFWAYFANAREKDIGWRIDYFFASSDLAENIEEAFISDDIMGSDHCPVGVKIAIKD